jgi:hypothetical protein
VVAVSAKSDEEAVAGEKNEHYGVRRAPEKLFFGGRVEGSAPHLSFQGQGKGREAYSVNFFRCGEMVLFFLDILIMIIIFADEHGLWAAILRLEY